MQQESKREALGPVFVALEQSAKLLPPAVSGLFALEEVVSVQAALLHLARAGEVVADHICASGVVAVGDVAVVGIGAGGVLNAVGVGASGCVVGAAGGLGASSVGVGFAGGGNGAGSIVVGAGAGNGTGSIVSSAMPAWSVVQAVWSEPAIALVLPGGVVAGFLEVLVPVAVMQDKALMASMQGTLL